MLRNVQGYAVISDPEKGVKECDTFKCNHCQYTVHVPPRADPAEMGGHCRLCDKLICPRCVGKECTPFMKAIEIEENRFYARQSYGV